MACISSINGNIIIKKQVSHFNNKEDH